jgi:uncharacterized OsmC-like protein
VKGFFGLGAEQEHSRAFTIDADHLPQVAAVHDGPIPVEIVLPALPGCLSADVASAAHTRGVRPSPARAAVRGDMEIAGILSLDADLRNGFSGIRVRFGIDADATAEEIAVVAWSQSRPAASDILTGPTK